MKIFYSHLLENYFAQMKIAGEIYEGTGETFAQAITMCLNEYEFMN